MPRTPDNILIAMRLSEAVRRVIDETPQGAPADRLYAGIKDHCTRAEFDSMMRGLVNAEWIVQRGDRFYPKGDAT